MTGDILKSHKAKKVFKGHITRPKDNLPLYVYQPNWSWDHKTHYWLLKQVVGEVLNFPCGMSRIGYRADADPEVKPDLIADLSDPLKYFDKLSYDTIICDPPFDLQYFNKLGWCHDLSKIARKKIIFSTPPMSLTLKKRDWAKTYHLTEKPGSRFIRIWQIFERKNQFITPPSHDHRG